MRSAYRSHRSIIPLFAPTPKPARKCIFLGDHAEFVTGMDYTAGRALIEEINALVVHPDLTYEHSWSPGQLIVWDNRCLLHRATPFAMASEARVIRRCTVLGEIPR